jgi:hypothetical protein
MQIKLLGIISLGFNIRDQLMIRYFGFVKSWRKNGSTTLAIHGLKKAYDSVRREVLYNILTKSGMCMKVASLNKMCLNYIYGKVRVNKHLSDMFPLHKGLKQENVSL